MNRKLTFILTVVLILSLLAGCGAKPKNEPSTNTTMQQQTQTLVDQAAGAQQQTQEAESEEVEEIEQDEFPEELQDSQEVTSSNAQDWIDLLCAHAWQAIDDLPDGGEWISIYTFNADGTFTYFGGWNRSEADADYAGTYEVSDDGMLTLIYTTGHQAEITYEPGFDIDTISFTQVGDEGLMYFHKAGQRTTLSAA